MYPFYANIDTSVIQIMQQLIFQTVAWTYEQIKSLVIVF